MKSLLALDDAPYGSERMHPKRLRVLPHLSELVLPDFARQNAVMAIVQREQVPALAKLLAEGIQRGEGHLDVAAGVRVPMA